MSVRTVDVVVIGGGIAGVGVAAALGADVSVAVLEQESELAYHASGRSAAAFLESYGSSEIRALTKASRPMFAPGVLAPRPLLWIGDDSGAAQVERLLAAEPVLRRADDVDARALCPAIRPGWVAAAAVEEGAQDLDVAALHEGYRRAAVARGVSVLRSAPVLSARPISGGWEVRTAGETLHTGALVQRRRRVGRPRRREPPA